MGNYSVNCGIHGEVFEVGGECSVCTLVERNQLVKQIGELTEQLDRHKKLYEIRRKTNCL